MSLALALLGYFTSYLHLCKEKKFYRTVGTGGQGDDRPQDFGRSIDPIFCNWGQIMLTTLLPTPSRFSDLPTALHKVQEKAIQLSKKINRQRCYIRAECSLLKRRKGKKNLPFHLEPSMKEH